jgi:putative membrane protein
MSSSTRRVNMRGISAKGLACVSGLIDIPTHADYCLQSVNRAPRRQDPFAMLDLLLAIGHHLLIFGIFGIICAEFWAVRPGLSSAMVGRIASIDLWYGILAVTVVAVGFCRAVFAAKGWAYYSHNAFFWAKLGTFAAIGLLSLPPTLGFMRWRKLALQPSETDIKQVRRYLHLEVALFMLLPIFAAAMARGYGEF